MIGRFPFPLPPFPKEPRKQHPLPNILNKLFIQEEQLKKAIIKWITKQISTSLSRFRDKMVLLPQVLPVPG